MPYLENTRGRAQRSDGSYLLKRYWYEVVWYRSVAEDALSEN
jgi:hypothetical protein